ncbi:potassium-activated aldehyde dehydrogenase, mitochondrial [Trichomonascus vanleenenianus]|uniref:succinate-semialdehyde dehydrogenase (NAD(P)(+)) n=1 Tax=Trichomonascus vanleenenianus TaxID=2268995 RepID=UPI003ECB3F8E
MSTRPTLKNPSLLRSQAFINGKWVDSSSGEKFKVVDPATTETIGEVADMTVEDLKGAIGAAKEAFGSFRHVNNRERAKLLRKWNDLITANVDDLAAILTWENGKPIAEAKGEVMSCVANFEFFAEEAPRIHGDTIPSQNANARIHTIKQPVGVCGIITPWNFPASMISRKVGAAIAAGCTTVIKPADATPYSALALAALADEAGIPKGVINVVPTHTRTKEFGKELCENKQVSKVTFTGSTAVGKTLMAQAAKGMKKVSFELGGNAPFIVFGDADVDAAVNGAIASKFRGSGQTCICANRIYVHESIYDEFAKKLADKVSQFKVGHGLKEGTTQGPLTSPDSVDKVQRHVSDALDKGATLLTGGKKLTELGGYFYAPTVITNVTNDMAVTKEETFGPLAALVKFSTDEEVLKHANSVDVGLAAYVYTKNHKRVHKISEGLEVGMVGINTGIITEPALPFGGVKESGFGREGSKYGLDDYLVVKSIVSYL